MDEEALSAVKEGNTGRLQRLVDQGININAQDDNGDTLLHHAFSNSQDEAAACLLQNGADVLITNNENQTVLHIAVMEPGDGVLIVMILQCAKREKLRQLLDTKVKANGDSALHLAAMCSSSLNAAILLEYGANYEMKNAAGEKPIDVAYTAKFGKTVEQIDECFRQAKNGEGRFISDLSRTSVGFLLTMLTNCTNDEGHTIMQELLLNDHSELMSELLDCRCEGLTKLFRNLHDRKSEFEQLINDVLEFRDYWHRQRQTIIGMTSEMKNKQRPGSKRFKMKMFSYSSCSIEPMVKLSCQALEKAHEVYLAYRKFDGVQRALTTDAGMKTVEEVLQVLGFDPEQLFAIAGKESCYYEKLPTKYKNKIFWMLNLIDDTIDKAFHYLLRNLYSMQIFEAVKADDIDQVKSLMKKGGSLSCLDYQNRSALCYAAETGNKKMIRLLIKSGVIMACNGLISPICMAINNGNAKAVKLILKYVELEDMSRFINYRMACKSTALHVAAKKGRLDIVKILLSHGATYLVFDEDGHTPLAVSTSQEVSRFLKMVDEFFQYAEAAAYDLLSKLKSLQPDEFMAVANTRNNEGHTLAVVAAKAGTKNIATYILKMVKLGGTKKDKK